MSFQFLLLLYLLCFCWHDLTVPYIFLDSRLSQTTEHGQRAAPDNKSVGSSGRSLAYLGEPPDLLDGHVEAEEVQGLAAHGGQVVHAHGLLLGEGQEAVHPHLPLRLGAQLVQAGDLLVGDGGRARLLGRRKEGKAASNPGWRDLDNNITGRVETWEHVTPDK